MRFLKKNPLFSLVNPLLVDSPQPINLSYLWNFGSLLAFSLVLQIITGITLAMHYNPSVTEAFNSVEHIMRDVNNGWLIRYLHANIASAFFFLVYLHIGRGMYYGSYKAPRTLVWSIGTIIFITMMATAFLGYVLPYGQMSLWGATVITNLMSAIPWIGQDIVEFIWGGFSVNNATLNRFFSLHFCLPFILAGLALMHLIVLHGTAGSGNPLGVSGNYDRISFAPYFIFKDLITIFIFIFILSGFVLFIPNVLGDSENYVMANPMQTPAAIVPEWYLLPFYAILRSIPNKLLGVIAMFSAILILLLLPNSNLNKLRGMQFGPLSKLIFYVFVCNFLVLMLLGAKHVEFPFIEYGQISAIMFFIYFIGKMPLTTKFENIVINLNSKNYYNINSCIMKSSLSPMEILKNIISYIKYFFSKFFSLKNILKHFTFSGITAGIFGIIVGSLIRYGSLGIIILTFFGIDPSLLNLSVLTGLLALISKLGIKGVLDTIIEENLPKQKLPMGLIEGDDYSPGSGVKDSGILNMCNTGNGQGSVQENPQGNYQGNPQGNYPGNPQGNYQGNSQGNYLGNP